MPYASKRQFGITVFCLSIRLISGQPKCYYPDGTLSTTDSPCNNSAEFSACCKSSAYCLSNGLCLENGILNRESCTDQSWTSSSCPQYCKNEASNKPCPLMPCTNTTFTCGLYPNDCAASGTTFEIKDLRPTAPLHPTTTTTNNNASSPISSFTSPEIAGTAVGIALPLLLIIALLTYLLYREKGRNRAIQLHNDQALYYGSGASPLSPGVREINTCSWSAWSARREGDVLERIRELEPAARRESSHHSVRIF
ncbi:uncharacterized protein MYCFIDRAFT_209624 [Pseudocercospora fijiensis CIRAD86]|uniref:Uncharacterized protein n=1 Tax=Pseudocercospora fijiensis (strain CIRAD86) TaxID=383855 RepID=N1QA96_PSEFD|nr:uncharacterized protein MYCFIDRAFT_209624 [Pseudocercospora fijiensis CIRAD86]EME87833.1 hypothetical protein MYCFIDRAFT_209624 [Pseudocercospora fijiensis CIRAD86]